MQPFIHSFNLFRCENGRAREIALIDFQYTRMTTPAVDVIYAIYTGSEPEMRAEHLTKWLKTYHDQFSYELNVFGYDANSVYSFAKFQEDVRNLFPIGLTWAFIVSKVNLIILYHLYVVFYCIESQSYLFLFHCTIVQSLNQ